ncbi:MAG TPA: hypothetical protein VHZ24_01100 [Pirellulales bacterium]|jgi:3-oxoacyl-[acyl-carrier-protein] synthase-1|nr:hypothetical protein [Pirellulales bacterium]
MFIAATGMVCPVGLTAPAACAALRAKVAGFTDLPFSDARGEPITGASVPEVGNLPRRASHLVEMLARALAEVLHSQPIASWQQVPLLIGLAETGRPGAPPELPGMVIAEVQKKLNVRFHPQHSRVFASGHTAGFEALRVARDLFNSGSVPACIVAAVDSLLIARTLRWLDEQFRLKTPANRDGVIPGEAAAAVLLQKTASQGTTTEISGLGFADEKAHIASGEPLLGLGLTAATRTALGEARLGLHEIDLRISDVTGELYGFKELPLVTARLMRVVRQQEQPLWHWAEAIGDTGAAAGVAQLVAADAALRKGYAPGNRVLGFTSAAGGARAAAVLHRWPRTSIPAKV